MLQAINHLTSITPSHHHWALPSPLPGTSVYRVLYPVTSRDGILPTTLASGSNPSSRAYLLHHLGALASRWICHVQTMIPNSSDCHGKSISRKPLKSPKACRVCVHGGFILSATRLQGAAQMTPLYEAFPKPHRPAVKLPLYLFLPCNVVGHAPVPPK